MRVGPILLSVHLAMWKVASVAQPEAALDSLLATWPAKETLAHIGDPKVVSWAPLDTSLSRERIRSLGVDLPIFQDDAVADAILRFGGPRRNDTELLLGMAALWMPLVESELQEAGLSTDLKYLPLAISAMNVQAVSAYGEAGPWMLTYPVALRYGLIVSDTLDQRHDMALSTAAAVAYLRDLDARFGKEQALLAFLCGPANLARAKAKSGGANTIAQLYAHADEAQRDRVPVFMALRYLANYADELGIRPAAVEPLPLTDTLRTNMPVRMDAFTRVMGIDAKAFAAMNPMIVGRTLPANTVVRVPPGTAQRYVVLADSIAHVSTAVPADTLAPGEPLIVGYTVEPGDNLSGIAEEYGVTVAEVKEWNALTSDNIRAGAILRIHVSAPQVEEMERERRKPEPPPKVVKKPKEPAPRVYIVRRGDTLSGIAKHYPGVSAKDIMRHNGIGESIRPGQKLKIPPR